MSKALWFIENHFDQQIRLEEIAQASGVTRFHLTRAFGATVGLSVMAYTRVRRLSEAAKLLAAGAPDILDVALIAGYNSHEAFTRAFREQFNLTPEALRAEGDLGRIHLLEPIRMDTNTVSNLSPPRFERAGPLFITGLGTTCNDSSHAQIPSLWQKFGPHIGHVAGQTGRYAYGVVCNRDDAGNREYIAGVAVTDFSRLPQGFRQVRLPERDYAVFQHAGHISTIRETWALIFNDWTPASGKRIADEPEFERYTETFDPVSGNGGVEIWIPLEDAK